jgi:peptide/nickel transport system permease protein
MTDITNGPARDAAELQDNFTTKRKRMSPAFWLAVAWISVLLVIAILAPLLPLHDPIRQDYRSLNSGPNSTYWLGTDHLGRDLLSRVLNGARISLSVATTAPFIGMFIGLVLGVSAGFFRGRVDNVVSVVIDSILAFPNIVLAIAFLFYAGNTLPNLILVIAFYTIPQFTRITRANTMAFAQREFILAARAQGASNLRIILRELLPNVLVPVAAYSLLIMSYTIILEGGLSFLGVGIPPPTPTWGRMISEGLDRLYDNGAITFYPSVFMFLTILSLNIVGDKLRSLTDIKASAA